MADVEFAQLAPGGSDKEGTRRKNGPRPRKADTESDATAQKIVLQLKDLPRGRSANPKKKTAKKKTKVTTPKTTTVAAPAATTPAPKTVTQKTTQTVTETTE